MAGSLLDLFIRIGCDDQASNKIDSIVTAATAKGNMIANAIGSAIGKIQDAVSAVANFGRSALDAYSQYEQNLGGVQTLFKDVEGVSDDAADTVIANAQRAFETAGVSMNQYMQQATSLASSMIQGVTKASQSAADSGVEAASAALDAQYKAQQRAFSHQATSFQRMLSDQYDAQAKAYQKAYDAYAETLQKEVQEAQKASQKRVEAAREASQKEIQSYTESVNKQMAAEQAKSAKKLSLTQKTLDEQEKQYQKNTDRLIKETQKANSQQVHDFEEATKERLRLMEEEYNEKVRLIDAETAARIKAIDKQIKAIEGQGDADDDAERAAERSAKISELSKRVESEKTFKKRQEAAAELAEYQAKIEKEDRDRQRKEQIEALKERRQEERDAAAERKNDAKEQYSEEIEQYKESRSKVLDAIKEANAEQVDALREARAEQLEGLREHNKAYLEQVKAGESSRLEKLREGHDKAIAEMQKEASDKLEALQESEQEQIEALQKSNQEKLANMQEAQQSELKQLQRSQEDQMTAYRESQSDQLEAMQESIKNQKKALQEAAESGGGYVEATQEQLKRAAELVDTAIIDMSDNANKMGTDLGMIQNAYQGFGRQTFVMLDNLKLGYGGSRSEMERLLDDAEKIKAKQGEIVEYSSDNLADIVEAIHTVQVEQGISGYSLDEITQKLQDQSLTTQELNRVWQDNQKTYGDYDKFLAAYKGGLLDANDALILTGTTSKEANETIEGSMRSMQAAYENWLISLADPSIDLGEATSSLVERVGIAAENIIPRMGVIVARLAEFLATEGPGLVETFKQSFTDALPEDMQEKFGQYSGFVQGIIDAFMGGLDVIQGGLAMLQQVIDYVSSNKDSIVQTIGDIVNILSGLGDFFKWLSENGQTIVTVISTVTAGFAAFKAALGIAELISTVAAAFGQVQFAIASLGGGIVELGGGLASLAGGPVTIIIGVIAALVAAFIAAYNSNEDFRNKVNEVWKSITDAVGAAAEAMKPVLDGIGKAVTWLKDTIGAEIEKVVGFFSGLPDRIKGYFEHPETLLHDIGVMIIKGLTNGLIQDPDAILNSLGSLVDNGINWFKGFFGMASPSKLMAQYGGYISEGLANGIDDGASGPRDAMQNAAESIYGSLDSATSTASSGFDSAIGQLMGYFGDMAESSDTQIGNVVRYFGGMPDDIIRGVGDVSMLLHNVGMNLISGLTQGIASNVYSIMEVLMGGVTNAVNAVKSWLGIASPSKRMAEIGDYMMQGWSKGIEDEQDATRKTMLDAARMVYGAADGSMSAQGFGTASSGALGGISIQIGEMIVREEADINRIADQLYTKIRREQEARGWSTSFTMA